VGVKQGAKGGNLRVKYEPPTLEEAFFAAQGLTDDVGQQIELAAALMNMPIEDVKAQAAELVAATVPAPQPVATSRTVRTVRTAGQAIVVERRNTHRSAARQAVAAQSRYR
jgi:hypothetical protein